MSITQGIEIEVITHAALTRTDLTGLRELFDQEYLEKFGKWNPDLPYGYAPHDVHVIVRESSSVVGHMGWGRRLIRVGDAELHIGGVGGVLVSPSARGQQLGQRLMRELVASMRDDGRIDFGFLGCDESVAAFYEACGWHRISAAERSVDRQGRMRTYEPGAPILIFPVNLTIAEWPAGLIDLRGRAW